jgi:3-methyladenine DNA glycosylase AlkD
MLEKQIIKDLNKVKSREKAEILSRFFKTGKGEYGAGDKFLGVVVPEQRRIAKKYYQFISLSELGKLLKSEFHEERLIALIILVDKFLEADAADRKKIFVFYLKNIKYINNWDLVDLSAPQIVGGYLQKHNRKVLNRLARSDNLWERRIAIVSTLAFIRAGQSDDTLRIARIFLQDEHDLIHKATGWMLREVGKKDIVILKVFLNKYKQDMPRTMLRSAIEKFSESERKQYLQIFTQRI